MNCPLRTSKSWKTLTSQVGEDLAWRTYVTYNDDYPSTLMSTTDLRKALAIPYKAFENNLPTYYAKIKKYNEQNKTSHTVKTKKIGQSQQVEIELVPNYLPKGHIFTLEKESHLKKLKETAEGLRTLDMFDQGPLPNESEKENIKPGVLELFKSNPELVSIGTPEQYSQYLDTIFPDSKVKDIVYRSNNKGEINTSSKKSGGFWFGDNSQAIENFMLTYYGLDYDDFAVKSALVNIENPKIFNNFLSKIDENEPFALAADNYSLNIFKNINNEKDLLEYNKESIRSRYSKFLKTQNYDSLIIGNETENWYEEGPSIGKQYVVFESEQIHILGSGQDIEGFKEFVNNQNNILFNQQENNEKKSNDPTFQQRLFEGGNAKTADKVLKNIIESGHELAPLAEQLLKDFGHVLRYRTIFIDNNTFEFIKTNGDKALAAAHYDPKTTAIYVYKHANFKEGSADIAIIHEIMHALSYDILKGNSKQAKAFKELYEKAKKLYKETGRDPSSLYGFENADEFLVALYSDKTFIEALSSLKSDNSKNSKSIWTEIKNFFKNLLKIQHESLFDEAFELASEVISLANAKKPTQAEIDANPDRFVKMPTESSTRIALTPEERKLFDDAIKNISRRLNYVKNTSIGTPPAFIKKIEKELTALETFKNSNNLNKAISKFLDIVDKDFKTVIDETGNSIRLISEFENGNIKEHEIHSEHVNALKSLIIAYDAMFEHIGNYIRRSDDPNIKSYKARFDGLSSTRGTIISTFKTFEGLATINWLKTIPGFQMSNDLFDSIKRDVSQWRVWFGSAVKSSSDFVRALSYKIQESRLDTAQHMQEFKTKIIALHNKLEAKGFDFNKLYEANGDYFISEYNRGEIKAAYDKLNAKINEIDNFEGDSKEFWQYVLALDKDTDILNKNKNKKSLKEDAALDKMKTAAKKALRDSFKKDNFKTYTDDEGEHTDPLKKYLNKDFYNIMKDPDVEAYYDLIINQRKKDIRKLPNRYKRKNRIVYWSEGHMSAYQIPQMRKSTLEAISTKAGFKRIVKENLGLEDIEDAYNKENEKVLGKVYNYVPVYYMGTVPKEERNTNITYGAIMFTYMATNFSNMNNVAANSEIMKEALDGLQFTNKSGTSTKPFAESNVSRTMNNMLDIQVYGKQIDPTYIPTPIGRINISQVLERVNNWMRNNNLVFKHVTVLSSFIKSSIDSKIEDIVGFYSTQKSKFFAEEEFYKQIIGAIKDWSSDVQTNPMHLFFEKIELFKSHKDQYKNLGQNKAKKLFLTSTFWYGMYESAAYRTNGKLALSISDNYRYYNGKFINYSEWTALGKTEQEWDKLKEDGLTFYQLMQNNDKINKKELEQASRRVILTIRKKVADIDGRLTEADRAGASKMDLLRLVLTHRSWLFRGIDNRFMEHNIDYETGEEVEGYYRTMWNFLGKLVKNKKAEYDGAIVNWKTASALEKRAIIRTAADLSFLIVLLGTYLLLSSIADDEDEYLIDYLAYVNTRVLMEHISLMSPTELYTTLQSPFPTVNRMMYLNDVFWGIISLETEEIERGPYEGMTRREKALIQLTPGLGVFWEYDDPDMKRNRLEQSYIPRVFLD